MKVITKQFALFKQTILSDSRSPGLFSLKFGFAIVLALSLYMVQTQLSGGRTKIDGLMIFWSLLVINICFVFLSAIGLFCGLVKEEKEDNNLSLILMTGTTPFAYLFGRFGSRSMVFVEMLLLQVPFTLLCITLGGISLGQILLCYLVLAIVFFNLATLSLLVSLVSTTLTSAIIMCVGLYIILNSLALAFLDDVMNLAGRGSNIIAVIFYSLEELMDTASQRTWILDDLSLAYFLWLIVSGITLFLLASRFFYGLMSITETRTVADVFKKKEKVKKRFSKRLPLIFKDFRFTLPWFWVYVLQFVFIGLVLWYYYIPFIWYSTIYATAFCYFCANWLLFFLGFLIVMLTSHLFASEIKSGTLSSLILLPRRHQSLFWQKAFVLLSLILPTLLVALAMVVFHLVNSPVSYEWNSPVNIMGYIRDNWEQRAFSYYIYIASLAASFFLLSFCSLVFRKYTFFTCLAIMLFYFVSVIFLINFITDNANQTKYVWWAIAAFITLAGLAYKLTTKRILSTA